MSNKKRRSGESQPSIEDRINEAMDPITTDEEYEDEYEEEDSEYEDEYEEEDPEYEDEYEEEDPEYEDEYEEGDPEYEDEYEEEDPEYEDEHEEEDPEYEDEYEEDVPGHKEEKKQPSRKRVQESSSRRSARPKKIAYVPITDEDLDSAIVPRKHKKKHKGLKVTGIVAAMMIVSAGCAYAAVSYYYSNHFFRGTQINGLDCSGKTAYEVEQAIAGQVENYSIQVLARDQEPESISGSSINYQYASDGEILVLLKSQKPYEWIRGFFETRSYTTKENATYDKTLLQNQVKALSCAKEENQVKPENAYVALSGSEFQIVPETQGSELKVKEAYKVLDAAVAGNQTTVDLGSDPEVYVQAAVTSDSPDLQAARDAYNNYTKASITYTFGDQQVTLDGGTLKDWLEVDEKGQLIGGDDSSFKQHITDFVAQLAKDHDTVGTTREFHTTSGRTVYVYSSVYGWEIDQAQEVEQLTQEISSGTQTVREPAYSKRAESHGYNDLGNTYIEVDLSGQHMYYYQDGSIIFDSDIVSGDMQYEDRKTPEGIYTLYWKKSPDVLRGKQKPDGTYEYETQVTYWMPFNGGIGFHDASWQPYFGGDRYLYGGSHGCINMPPANAAILYNIIQYDVPIICFY